MKFSSKKAKITKDWAASLPGFEVARPRHAMRLHGPVAVGVCLDETRDKVSYQPIAHVHALVVESPVISLSMPSVLRAPNGAERTVPVERHDADLVDNVARIMESYPLIQKEQIAFSDYVGLAAQCLSGAFGKGFGYLPNIYRDIVLVAAYLGEHDFAQSQLSGFESDLNARSDFNVQIIGSVDQWADNVRSSMDVVGRIVDSERERHKMAGLSDRGMRFDVAVSLFDLK